MIMTLPTATLTALDTLAVLVALQEIELLVAIPAQLRVVGAAQIRDRPILLWVGPVALQSDTTNLNNKCELSWHIQQAASTLSGLRIHPTLSCAGSL